MGAEARRSRVISISKSARLHASAREEEAEKEAEEGGKRRKGARRRENRREKTSSARQGCTSACTCRWRQKGLLVWACSAPGVTTTVLALPACTRALLRLLSSFSPTTSPRESTSLSRVYQQHHRERVSVYAQVEASHIYASDHMQRKRCGHCSRINYMLMKIPCI